ncbi:MAG: hypothetical protein ACJ76Y_30640 [Thermoanaerobaculia bacterium]
MDLDGLQDGRGLIGGSEGGCDSEQSDRHPDAAHGFFSLWVVASIRDQPALHL